jgi:lysophospholipase L1-like esterase
MRGRRILAVLTMLAVLTVLVAFAPAGGATERQASDATVYVSLGDSVAAGTIQPRAFTGKGYTDVLFRRVGEELGLAEHVSFACPGDDTQEMIDGTGSFCFDTGFSQLDAALGFFATEVAPGVTYADVTGLITLTIGANDILACEFDDPDVAECAAAQLGQIGANLPVILAALQAAAPGVPIVAMNYYNPNLAWWITGAEGQALAAASNELAATGNDVLEDVYAAFGVTVADVERWFRTFDERGKDYPLNVRYVCRYTGMCERVAKGVYTLSDYDPSTDGPQTDIHPNNRGYKRIASAFIQAMTKAGILS